MSQRTHDSTLLATTTCWRPHQSHPVRWKWMSLEEFFARAVRVRRSSFIAHRFDVAHLNIFITLTAAVREDDAAGAGFTSLWHHLQTLGSDYLVHSKPADLLAAAQCQLDLRTARRAFDQLVERVFAVRGNRLHSLVSDMSSSPAQDGELIARPEVEGQLLSCIPPAWRGAGGRRRSSA